MKIKTKTPKPKQSDSVDDKSAYILTGSSPCVHYTALKPKTSKCPNTGKPLDYAISVFMTYEKRHCPHCGKEHYVDYAQIDWEAVNANRIT